MQRTLLAPTEDVAQLAEGARSGESAYAFTCFFVYGCDEVLPDMGEVVDTRNARGMEFKIFDFKEPSVQKKAYEFYQLVMNKQ
ncbi:MAG: hypothetical protein ABIK68_07395 [bacterium]